MKKNNILAALIASSLMLAQSAWADETIDKLREHLSSSRFDAAYALSQDNQDRLGDPEFDLLFGITAIETGRGGEGVLALERYLMSAPQDAQATLHLARGYLILGEAARARAELDGLLASSPAAEVADAANALLEVVRTQEVAAAGSARFYVEAGFGADSNVNGGVGSSVVSLPVFGMVTLPGNVTQNSDNFSLLGAGFQATRKLEPGLTVFGGIDTNLRTHLHDNAYDQQALSGNFGATLNRGGSLWRATASFSTLELEHDRYRNVSGIAGEWATGLYPGGMLNAFLQYARFDYAANDRDADFYGIGAGYRRIFTGAMRPTFNLALTYGEEHNDRNRPDYSRNLWGVSGGVSVTPMPRLSLSASLMHQESNYRDDDPLLLATRKDRFDSLTLGAIYLINRNVSLRGEIAYMDNHSNIALYAYDRLQGQLKLRYDF